MAEASPWIAIVDDDPAVLRALSRLLRSHAFRARTYGSGREFLAALRADVPDCLSVDLGGRRIIKKKIHQHLVSNGITIPTILITAHADVALRDQGAMVASLRKPLQEQALFDAIDKACAASRGAG